MTSHNLCTQQHQGFEYNEFWLLSTTQNQLNLFEGLVRGWTEITITRPQCVCI